MVSAGEGVSIEGEIPAGAEWVLSSDAVAFVARLHRQFDGRRLGLLEARKQRQAKFDQGRLPDFLPETEWVRKQSWKCQPPPADLEDRRVEITGPPDRKMVTLCGFKFGK
jgi:malate synthase